MDEAERVLARLRRIGELERAGAAPAVLLDELGALATEATQWARAEGEARARAAAARIGEALDRRAGAPRRAPPRRS